MISCSLIVSNDVYDVYVSANDHVGGCMLFSGYATYTIATIETG